MKRILISASILLLIGGVWWWKVVGPQKPDQHCRFTALDVGQGDSLLLQTPDHQDVVIDGGPGSAALAGLSRHLPRGDRDIELMVSTHPDADHLAGLIPILAQYHVGAVLTTGVEVDTTTWKQWSKALAAEQTQITYAHRGERLVVGKYLTLEVLWPEQDLHGLHWTAVGKNGVGGTNDTGVVLRATCNGSTALFIADISGAVEDHLAEHPELIQSSLLKVAHHGSRYSSTSQFLQAVKPHLAIISVGAKNRYGHPHPTVLDRLQRLGIPVRRTDQGGDVSVQTDGHGGWR